jgi:hypothetical protein
MPDVESPVLGRRPGVAERCARVAVVAVGIGLWLGTQSLLGARDVGVDEATMEAASRTLTVGDRVHEWTADWNAALDRDRRKASGLLIASSVLIDLVACWMFAATIFGASIRPFLGLLILFSLRQLCQWLSALPAPVGMLWYDPGFPSLLVTYEVANDFFFSGHTALAVYGGIEVARRFGRVGMLLGVVVGVFQVTTVLVLRAHYTIDVFTGAVVAVLAAVVAGWLAGPLDRWVAKVVGSEQP